MPEKQTAGHRWLVPETVKMEGLTPVARVENAGYPAVRFLPLSGFTTSTRGSASVLLASEGSHLRLVLSMYLRLWNHMLNRSFPCSTGWPQCRQGDLVLLVIVLLLWPPTAR